MRCPICGQELDSDAKFCARCGKQIPRCPTCGQVLYERSRFCANDGTPLPETLFAGFPEARSAVSPPPPASRPKDRPAPPPRQKKKGIATAVIVVILLLAMGAAVAAGTYYFLQNGLPFIGGGAEASSQDDRDSRRDDDEDDGNESSVKDQDKQDDEVQEALEQAGVYAGAREYDNALAVIRQALEENPKSRKLKNALEEYEDLCATAVMEEADRLIGEGRLEEAKGALSQGLSLLPERTELQDKIDQVDGLITQADAVPPVSMAGVASVASSSFLSEPNVNLYHTPERTVDGDLSTAWVEGVDGHGIGESISFTFDRTYRFSGMRINAGYQKSDKLYQMNNRPASLTITFSDGTQQTVLLQDLNARQDISFTPVEAEGVTLTIVSVYEGTTYADTVISEISFY